MANMADTIEVMELYIERYGEAPMRFDVESLLKWHRERNKKINEEMRIRR